MLPSAESNAKPSTEDPFDFFDSNPSKADFPTPVNDLEINDAFDWNTFDNDTTLKWFDNEHHGIIPDPKQDLINYKAELLHADEIEILMTHFLTNICLVNKENVPVEIELLIFKFVGNLFFESTILDEENKRILLSLLAKYKKWDLNQIEFDLFTMFNDDQDWINFRRRDNINQESQKWDNDGRPMLASGSCLIVKSNHGRIFGAIIGAICDPFLFVLSDDKNDIEPKIFELFAPQSSKSNRYKINKWTGDSRRSDEMPYVIGESDLMICTVRKRCSCMSDTFEAVGNELCGGDEFVMTERLGASVEQYFFDVAQLEEHNITWNLL